MKIGKNQEIILGINSTETVINFRKESVKTLVVLDSNSNQRVKKIIELATSKDIKIFYTGNKFFKDFKDLNHQGIGIICKHKQEENELFLDKLLEKKTLLLLILDHLTDPHNVGACLRSAAAANVDAVIVPKDRSCHLNPTVRKVSSGASELISFVVVTNLVRILKKIRSHGVEIVGADPMADKNYLDTDLGLKVAFVIGSEDKGLKRLTALNCNKLVKINMPGKIESLNTSVSAGVLLFEYLRRNNSAN